MTGNQDGSRAIQRSFNRRKLFQKLATHRRQGHTALPNGVHIRFNQPEYVEFAGEGEIAVWTFFRRLVASSNAPGLKRNKSFVKGTAFGMNRPTIVPVRSI